NTVFAKVYRQPPSAIRKKGPANRALVHSWSLLLADRCRLAVLPNIDVIDRILDVAFLVEGERSDGRVVGLAAQRSGDLGRVVRLCLVGGLSPNLDSGIAEERVALWIVLGVAELFHQSGVLRIVLGLGRERHQHAVGSGAAELEELRSLER